MSIISLSDYKERTKEKRPREITFYSPLCRDKSGQTKSVNICVRIEDGNTGGVLNGVIEQGGIGERLEDGTIVFIPWPCAAIEVRDL